MKCAPPWSRASDALGRACMQYGTVEAAKGRKHVKRLVIKDLSLAAGEWTAASLIEDFLGGLHMVRALSFHRVRLQKICWKEEFYITLPGYFTSFWNKTKRCTNQQTFHQLVILLKLLRLRNVLLLHDVFCDWSKKWPRYVRDNAVGGTELTCEICGVAAILAKFCVVPYPGLYGRACIEVKKSLSNCRIGIVGKGGRSLFSCKVSGTCRADYGPMTRVKRSWQGGLDKSVFRLKRVVYSHYQESNKALETIRTVFPLLAFPNACSQSRRTWWESS